MTRLEPWVLVPGLIGRQSHERGEAAKDGAVLTWVARFRFVTAELTGLAFGVSWQRANARLRRLERQGLIVRQRLFTGMPLLVHCTGRGFELLGQRRRTTPRVEVQRDHELAIVAHTIDLERRHPGSRVLSERESRAADDDASDRFCTNVVLDGRWQQGWPDLVVDHPDRRIAVEIELSAKSPKRLEAILDGYARSTTFTDVHYVVADPRLADQIARLYHDCAIVQDAAPRLQVVPLPGLPPQATAAIHAAGRQPHAVPDQY